MSKGCRFSVAICGGGIGGITLAFFILKYATDIHVDLYEAGSEFSEIGAGITVWKRTWKIMQLLGLDGQLGEIAMKVPKEELTPSFVFRKADMKEGLDFLQMVTPYGSITLHRRDALKVLVDNLPHGLKTHFSKRLVDYQLKERGVILQFADGTEAEADILVGADGVRSATRGVMYRQMSMDCAYTDPMKSTRLLGFVQPTWSGIYAYRFLIDTERLLEKSPNHRAATIPTIYVGKNKHVVAYPVSQGRQVNFVGSVFISGGEGERLEGPTSVDVPKQELVDHFKGWEQDVLDLIHCCDKPSRWMVNTVRGLPHFSVDRVALLGDAAHAMTPHFGAGAGQAIEDAHTLGRLLSNTLITQDTIPVALRVYQAVRQPFVTQLFEGSRETGMLYDLSAPGLGECDNATELKKVADKICENWTWQWTLEVEDDWKKAEDMLIAEVKRSRL